MKPISIPNENNTHVRRSFPAMKFSHSNVQRGTVNGSAGAALVSVRSRLASSSSSACLFVYFSFSRFVCLNHVDFFLMRILTARIDKVSCEKVDWPTRVFAVETTENEPFHVAQSALKHAACFSLVSISLLHGFLQLGG